MSPGEVVVEGVVVEQPAEPTAGEVLGISKRMGVKYVGKEGGFDVQIDGRYSALYTIGFR